MLDDSASACLQHPKNRSQSREQLRSDPITEPTVHCPRPLGIACCPCHPFRPLIHHNFVTMAVPRCLNTKIHTFTPRISSRPSLLQPFSHRSTTPTTFRFFSSSPANMTIKAWFDVEYTDAALDKARADAERSGGAVPPRKLPFLSSIHHPTLLLPLSRGSRWLHCKSTGRRSTLSTLAHLPLILDTSLTHSSQPSGVVSTSTSTTM